MTVRFFALLLLSLPLGCTSGPAPAEPVPAEVSLSLIDSEGAPQDLDAALARGETVALVFWQTWCASCAKEAPAIAAAAQAEQGKIRFVSVVPGKTETVKDGDVAAKRKAWGYEAFPLVRDLDLSLSRALGVRGTPTILVLGKDRVVRFKGHRPPEDWSQLRGAALAGGASPSPTSGDPECVDGVCPLPTGS
ncbi:MAG: redoxin family protein [Planctomycetes bacterium]|nr:redoxin family protein [Planctomycetota bacterium]